MFFNLIESPFLRGLPCPLYSPGFSYAVQDFLAFVTICSELLFSLFCSFKAISAGETTDCHTVLFQLFFTLSGILIPIA